MLTDITLRTIADFEHITHENKHYAELVDFVENGIERVQTGVYKCVGHNPDIYSDDISNCGFCDVTLVDRSGMEWGSYGVADSIEQIPEKYDFEASMNNAPLVLFVTEVTKAEKCGWRWHKWGPYIGTKEPQCEYLDDEPEIDRVFCYSVYPVKRDINKGK